MRKLDDTLSVARLLAIAIGVLCLLAVVVAASTSATTYGPFNSGWNGTSALWSGLDDADTRTTIAADVDELEVLQGSDTALLVLSPPPPIDDQTIEAMRRFVRAGGTLVIAEDFGAGGNNVLAGIGARARFDGDMLRDERRYWDDPSRPIVGNDSTGELTLNRGTAVRSNGARVLIATSPVAYLDENDSGTLDVEESIDRYAVVASEREGDGRVVAVGDPSVFVNGMRSASGNPGLPATILDAQGRVVFDLTWAPNPPPLASAYLLFERSSRFQSVVGLLGLGVVALWFYRPWSSAGPRQRGIVRRITSGVEAPWNDD